MSKELINVLNSSLLSEVRFTAILPSAWPYYSPPLRSRVKKCGMTAAWLTARKAPEHVSTYVLRLLQTGAKYSQRQRSLRCEFCRGLERTRRQVAVPTLARKNRADVCEAASIYSLSLLARFLSLSPRIVQWFQFRELAPAGDKNHGSK